MGLYRLALIMRRKRSWLHGGSNPSRPTNKKNMKYSIIILMVLILSSCDDIIGNKKEQVNTVSKPIEIKKLDTSIPQYERYYQVYTLDGCEYIEINYEGNNSFWGAHKGNCKNSIHKKDK